MKKNLKLLGWSVLGIFVLGVMIFFVLTHYYTNHFPINIWVNGVYCTGKTVEEVNSELIEASEASVVIITDANRAYWEIPGESADIRSNYKDNLRKFLYVNGQIFWTGWLKRASDIQMSPDSFHFDEIRLRQSFEQTDFVLQELEKPYGVSICCENDVYFLYDGNKRRLDVDGVYNALVTALESGKNKIDLQEIDCYRDLQDTETDIARRELWNRLQEFADCKLVYDMGTEQIEITRDLVLSFLEKEENCENANNFFNHINFLTDVNGDFIIDEAAVNTWIDQLLNQYNTCGTTKAFRTTDGDMVMVPYVKYGTELDGKAEAAYLLSALKTKRNETEVHTPAYIQQGFVRGLDDIGGTYIEIDMTMQKMYYYLDGTLMLETDVVTGDMQDNMETPEGINFVYAKQRNRTLRGPGYTSFVKYWMPVNGGVGIHDASWRSKFGGEIYLKNGSHGCINTPSDIMDDFYDAVEVGTPVIMFY